MVRVQRCMLFRTGTVPAFRSVALCVPASLRLSAALCLTASLLFASSPANAQRVRASANGVSVTLHGTTLQVQALRDDVLRVREWRGNAAPEDASWAVLPAARTATVAVTKEARGFHTARLRVAIDESLRLTVSDVASGTVLQQDAEPIDWHGESFKVRKRRSFDDHFFGLGDKPGPLDRGGQAFTMWNTDSFGFQESTDPIYKTIPFFLDVNKGRTLGVFFDNTWRSNFDFGREDVNVYSFGSLHGAVDYYLIYGPQPKAVVSAYAWLTGPSPLPPVWALGFQQSRYSYYPQTQVQQIADRMRADRIPSDVLWLDIDYQNKNMPFTVDTKGFPDFAGMIHHLTEQHFHTVIITDLHIARQPNAGYAPYDSGVAGDHFVKNPDGSTYVGAVWPGPSVFPDFTRAHTRAWWGTLFKDFAGMGVAGFWNDMNEPAVFETPSKTMPDTVQHRIDEPGFAKRTATHLEVHNVFGMQNSRATYDGLLTIAPNERPFVMTRASYAGGQRYSTTWTGDNSATWNHLRFVVPQLVNLGLSGFSLAGADVGGFAGSPPPDLLTKWIETATFQPIDRDHSAKGTRMHEVWVDGPQQEAIRRRYIEERYRLLPYLYTVAEETSRNGLPFNRPLFLEFPDSTSDGHPIDLDGGDEFLVGGRMLVAPNPSPEEVAPYPVNFPDGTWYDYWTGERHLRPKPGAKIDQEQRDAVLASRPVMVEPTLETLPVYVRGGSILPIAPLTQSTDEVPQGPLTLRVYPPAAGEPCEGDVYADDGHTFNFRKGEFARVHFSCTVQPGGGVSVSIGPQVGSYKPWWSEYRVEVVGLDLRQHTGAARARKPRELDGVTVPADPKGTTVSIE